MSYFPLSYLISSLGLRSRKRTFALRSSLTWELRRSHGSRFAVQYSAILRICQETDFKPAKMFSGVFMKGLSFPQT